MTMTTMTMTSEGIIRFASEDDIESIKEVEEKAFGIHAYDYLTLKYMVTEANSVTVVFEIDKKVIAYATVYFRKNSSIAHLESIAVHPSMQGKGIGRILLEEIEKISQNNGCKTMILETFERNIAALKLYKNSGYNVKGIVENYYTIPYEGSRNAVRLVKNFRNNI